ncbi:gamma-glutamyltransferase 5a isoform X2 [Electrophorus electricus]|uniref:gamma-glutamyltransferase 5a isoform X2 n=1 Tax=Electrophorus electricus TaxID=8005 RepID=UPI0015D0AA17|nr:gamma-glutamyltransferase 5a isoform X2 [Electrophorus electricus]
MYLRNKPAEYGNRRRVYFHHHGEQRETAPNRVKPDLLSACSSEGSGSQWIGVPGEIRGYEKAHRLYGRLPWADLFQPTIQLAREGIPISIILQHCLHIPNNTSSPLRQLFMDAEGNMLKQGDTVKFERLADTLEMIAKYGADVFYTGDIAKDLISDIQEAGGTLTLEDLSSFTVSEPQAWNASVGDYTMYFPPPPSGGATLSFILKVMQGYNLSPASVQGEERVHTFHRYVEACKFANGLRKLMKDPAFGSQMEASAMIQEKFAQYIRGLISSNSTYKAVYYNITPHVDTQGTSHVSVLAEDGMAVSVTSTINHLFGSKVLSPKTGVILNNQLFDFCGKVNQIHPGERPPSSMAPVVLASSAKKHTVIIGASGGSMITTGISMTLMNHLWFGKSLKDSIAAPVVFVNSKNALRFEPDFDKGVIEALQALGHTVDIQRIFYNVVNAVSKRRGCIDAVSDTRKMGRSSGY